MRTLVVSIGNTSISAAVFASGRGSPAIRVPAQAGAVPGLFFRWGGKIDRAVLCSVVPKLTRPIVREMQKRFGVTPHVLTAGSPHGLKIGYRRPVELGADRIAAALGARVVSPGKPAIVVDCGTATTVTALGRDGAILGGAIFPGLALWPAMLAARTAQLPEVELSRPRAALGRSTQAGLQSGIFHGHVGAIRELIGRIREEAFGRAPVIVIGTGGNASLFGAEKIFARHVPDLVLIGLDQFARALPAEGL